MSKQIKSEKGWCLFCSNGHPEPYLLIYYLAPTRSEVIKQFCLAWANDYNDPKTWKQLYRKGWRVVRVDVFITRLEADDD